MMKRYYSVALMVLGLWGCNRYAYPGSAEIPALSANMSLLPGYITGRGIPSTSQVSINDFRCDGGRYVLNVHYDTSMTDLQQMQLQYQIVSPNFASTLQFTNPMGSVELPLSPVGEMTVGIPASDVPDVGSQILVRLKLRSATVFESISAFDNINVDSLCGT